MAELVRFEQVLLKVGVLHRPVLQAKELAGRTDEVVVASDQAVSRVLIQKGPLVQKTAGIGKVVRIHPGDVFPLGLAHAAIERGGKAAILLTYDAKAGIAEGRQNVLGAVGGTIVYDHELKVAERLEKDAPDGLGQKGLSVQDRHDNADLRHVSGLSGVSG